MSYSSSNHSASGRSVKFRDLEAGAGDASGSRTSKMSAALSFDASVGLLSDASASTTSSRRGRLGKPAPLRSVSSAAEAKEDDSPFRFLELLKQIYALFAALPGYDAFKVRYGLLQVVRVVTALSFLVGLYFLSPTLHPSLDAKGIKPWQWIVLLIIGLINIFGRLEPFVTKKVIYGQKQKLSTQLCVKRRAGIRSELEYADRVVFHAGERDEQDLRFAVRLPAEYTCWRICATHRDGVQEFGYLTAGNLRRNHPEGR